MGGRLWTVVRDADDDQGDVVLGFASADLVGDEVQQFRQWQRGVFGEQRRGVGDAGVDVAAGLVDEPVGVEKQGRAWRERDSVLGAGQRGDVRVDQYGVDGRRLHSAVRVPQQGVAGVPRWSRPIPRRRRRRAGGGCGRGCRTRGRPGFGWRVPARRRPEPGRRRDGRGFGWQTRRTSHPSG